MRSSWLTRYRSLEFLYCYVVWYWWVDGQDRGNHGVTVLYLCGLSVYLVCQILDSFEKCCNRQIVLIFTKEYIRMIMQ